MNRNPSDWPEAVLVDLTIQDLPHDSASTEWWYAHCHLKTSDGREFSLFAAFFRIVHKIDGETGEKQYAHSIAWALSDPANRSYFQESLVDKRSPEIALERIRGGQGPRDARLRKAIVEVLEKNLVPSPDKVFKGDSIVSKDHLELDFDGNRFQKEEDGSYRLILINPGEDIECELVFIPEMAPVCHGDGGVVKGMWGEDMFYYFIPQCGVKGKLSLKGVELEVMEGSGWYDHEFGGHRQNESQEPEGRRDDIIDGTKQSAWNWAGIQLEDGRKISAYSIVDPETDKAIGQWLITIHPDGRSEAHNDMILTPEKMWRSTRTFTDYPVSWRLISEEAGICLKIHADFDDQEFITIISKPAFWEGRCIVEGTVEGKEVSGLAFLERSGFEPLKDLDDFFSAVGETVRESVKSIIPLDPTYEQVRELIASKERDHYMAGVDIAQISRALFKPVREITDRGGKAWRSYGIMVCCDAVGGDSRKYAQWLSLPEFLHVGSLIVDDVEDDSIVRRGGPSCHLVYGMAKAINAGTAAYFLGQKILHSDELSDAEKLCIYDLYFEALRAGHAGQAIDLDGADEAMEKAVETGDSSEVELMVNAWQRLKTAVPAASLARIGAVGGKGSKEQIEGLGQYFEELGLSFQIMDDVLNLRGFKGELKIQGEDIMAGKVTFPIAKAMSRLSNDDRRWMWDVLKSRTDNREKISEAIAKLEACGALDACIKDAEDLIEKGWGKVEPLLENSIPKVMLRAFSLYLLDRQY